MQALLVSGFFLVNVFFSLLLLIFWLRWFLRLFRISYVHPVHRVIQQLTAPLLHPFERIFYAKRQKPVIYDGVCMGVIIATTMIKFICLGLLAIGSFLPLAILGILTLGDLLIQPLNLFFYMILIQAVMSWINPNWHHPVAEIIARFTRPLLHLGRQLVPNISGFDFSPFIILIILKVLTLFISALMPMSMMSWL